MTVAFVYEWCIDDLAVFQSYLDDEKELSLPYRALDLCHEVPLRFGQNQADMSRQPCDTKLEDVHILDIVLYDISVSFYRLHDPIIPKSSSRQGTQKRM